MPREKRKVEFITCIAYVNKNGEEKTFTGVLEGYISEIPRGNNGFGFDEIFELENGKTLAELSNKEKNNISSRKIALEKLKETIK